MEFIRYNLKKKTYTESFPKLPLFTLNLCDVNHVIRVLQKTNYFPQRHVNLKVRNNDTYPHNEITFYSFGKYNFTFSLIYMTYPLLLCSLSQVIRVDGAYGLVSNLFY